ncbi:MAG: bacteriohemerythrin [Desulfovibrionaceae bacterium]
MALFRWDDSYLTHIASIDDQHKMLFECVQELHTQLQRGEDRQGVLDALQGMRGYAAYHFEEEEVLMRDAAYPALEAHVSEHRQFTERIDELERDAPSDYAAATREMLIFLVHWLVDHILVADHAYVRHLVKEAP